MRLTAILSICALLSSCATFWQSRNISNSAGITATAVEHHPNYYQKFFRKPSVTISFRDARAEEISRYELGPLAADFNTLETVRFRGRDLDILLRYDSGEKKGVRVNVDKGVIPR